MEWRERVMEWRERYALRYDKKWEYKMSSDYYYIYILVGENNRVMYIGVTNDLHRRLREHRNEEIDGFVLGNKFILWPFNSG